MAPIVPGDFLTYSGFMAANEEIICYAIVAENVQILTNGNPTYIRMEDALIGVGAVNTAIAEVADTRA